MLNKKLPKVLVVGQSFNYLSGGGVTLSNLFINWKDSDSLFSIHLGKEPVDYSICNEVYSFSNSERTPLIFSFFVNKNNKLKNNNEKFNDLIEEKTQKKQILRTFFYNFAIVLGVNHFFHVFKLSNNLKKWLFDVKPDVLYAQFSDYSSMRFILKLSNFLNIPLIVHVMDDWISIPPISNTNTSIKENFITRKIFTYLNKYYYKKIIKRAKLRLAISENMAFEYKKRYDLDFGVSHNYVDLNVWKSSVKRLNDKNKIIIRYFGTINLKNINILRFFIKSISNKNHYIFEIFTSKNNLTNSLHGSNTRVYEMLNQEEYKIKLIDSDLLLLPLSFDKISEKYAKLSIPTKLSEYLVSGVPTIVFSPPSSALSKFCTTYNCAYLINKKSESIISNSLDELRGSDVLYEFISKRAIEVANEKLSKEIILSNFEKKFKEILNNNN